MRDIDQIQRFDASPVHTDDDVVDLVRRLLEHPIRRQCWVLFLGDDDAPVQLVVPIADLPYEPDDRVDAFGEFLSEVCESIGARAALVVWERPGTTAMYPCDWSWVDAVACACAEHGVVLRGQVLLHEDGAVLLDLRDDVLEAA